MKNLHVLPTDKPSEGYILGKCIKELSDVKLGEFTKTYYFMFDKEYFQPHNMYITSDEEIKEGDWILTKTNNLFKADSIEYLESHNMIEDFDKSFYINSKYAKKIILTTDQDLIKDGVQAIDDEFLNWFIKNPSCEWVEVEIDSYMDKNISDSITFTDYKIIIPKEEHKQYLKDIRFKNKYMNSERIKEIQAETAYPQSRSVQQALLKVWNECEQEQDKNKYSEEEVLNFTQIIIQQYKLGNTNIEQLDLLKETLQQFKNKKFPQQEKNEEAQIPDPSDFMKLGEEAFVKNVHEKLRERLSLNEKQMWINGYLLALTNFKQFQEQDKNVYSEEEAYKIWKAGQEYWKTSGESKTFEEFIEQFKKK